jgi:hypothetical protein
MPSRTWSRSTRTEGRRLRRPGRDRGGRDRPGDDAGPAEAEEPPPRSSCALSIPSTARNEWGLLEYLVVYGKARVTEGGAAEVLQRLAYTLHRGTMSRDITPVPAAGIEPATRRKPLLCSHSIQRRLARLLLTISMGARESIEVRVGEVSEFLGDEFGSGTVGLRARSDVLVDAKQVVRVVDGLDPCEGIVVVSVTGSNAVLALVHHHVHVRSTG